MPAAITALAFLAATLTQAQVTRNAPAYTAATIINAASGDPNTLAPYTIVKINGTDLAWGPYTMQPSDVRNSMVPPVLPNTGVRVFINYQAAGILSVSPTQITILVPGDLIAGPAVLWTSLDGLAGPQVTINLTPFGPGLFVNPDNTLIVSSLTGLLITPDVPANPGDTLVLYAVGLGPASPPLLGLEIASTPLPLDPATTIAIYINGNPIDPSLITNVGFLPGQAGIYQLTVQLPADTPANPEVRIEASGIRSPPGFTIPVSGVIIPMSSSRPRSPHTRGAGIP